MSASETDHGPVIETEQLEGLLMAAGADGLNDILDAFWRSTDELVAAMETQIANGELDEAAKTAHAIKGSASNVGANLLAGIARVMEDACKSGDQAQLAAGGDDARAAVAKTRDAIADLMANAA